MKSLAKQLEDVSEPESDEAPDDSDDDDAPDISVRTTAIYLRKRKLDAHDDASDDDDAAPRDRPRAGGDGDDDEGDDDEGEGDDDDDDPYADIVETSSKRGKPVFRVGLMPDRGPFDSREAAKAFMRGATYRRKLKAAAAFERKVNRSPAASARAEHASERKAERAAKRRRAKRSATTAALSAEQIAARKAKFARKKERRRQRGGTSTGEGAPRPQQPEASR